MEKFLYVFSKRERDELLALNYALIKSDDMNGIYVFENQSELRFNTADITAIPSDTLTF